MKLRFYWSEQLGRLEPGCDSDTLNRDGVSVLASLLMDTGGVAHVDTLSWLEEGLRRLDSVKRGDKPSARWGREAWGASVTHDRVDVYSLHDETYVEILSLHAFERVLRAWIDFLRSPADVSAETTLVV